MLVRVWGTRPRGVGRDIYGHSIHIAVRGRLTYLRLIRDELGPDRIDLIHEELGKDEKTLCSSAHCVAD